ncbi:ATP-binding domain-containing protein [Phytohalomonas tamaricis]|uniref:ATP-binding domain-containing protein n=1 Tax=Phytohalomonas tamaricis TaxID=2081032 RepID=UPI000D0BA566|nr:ATP-binding domain-containing protein [Phytohalomonas tamaricis]
MVLSEEQRHIIEAILKALDSEGNERVRGLFRIPAVAGAGKTVTITELARALGDRRIVFMCFSRNIIQRAQGALPANVLVRTLHALAHDFLKHSYSRKIDNSGIHHRLALSTVTEQLGIGYRDARLVRLTLERFHLSGQSYLWEDHLPELPEDKQAWQAGEQKRIVDATLELWQRQRDAYDSAVPLTFDAMIKLWALAEPVYVNARADAETEPSGKSQRITQFGDSDILILEEAQDAPEVVLDFLARQPQLLVFIGDPNQEIRSVIAPAQGLDHPLLRNAINLELRHSYRFGASVAAALSAILTARDGRVTQRIEGLGTSRLEDSGRFSLEQQGLHYTLIARTLTGVLSEAVSLKLAGKQLAWIDGIYAYNIALLRDLAWLDQCARSNLSLESDNHPFHQIRKHIRAKYNCLDDAQRDFERNGDNESLQLIALVKAHRNIDLPRLINQLTWEERERQNAMMQHSDQAPPRRDVTLTTVSRAKGLEFERVVLANDFELDVATDATCSSAHRQLELNMLYTAASRAKYLLVMNEALRRIVEAEKGTMLPEAEITLDYQPPITSVHPYFGAHIDTLMEMNPKLRNQRHSSREETAPKTHATLSGQTQLKNRMLQDAKALGDIRPGKGGVRAMLGMRIKRRSDA